MNSFNIAFKSPSNIIISGPSQSGKTQLAFNLLKYKHEMFEDPPQSVLFFYSEWASKFDEMEKNKMVSEFHQNIPSIDDLKILLSNYSHGDHKICIFDDLLHQINATVSNAFTVIGSKTKTTFVFLSQAQFHNNEHYKLMSQNAHALFICKSIRDKSHIISLAKQFSPYDNKLLVQAYSKATNNTPYSYLFIDCHQKSVDALRLRTSIFPHEWPVEVYIS